jgi:hypothetical protein
LAYVCLHLIEYTQVIWFEIFILRNFAGIGSAPVARKYSVLTDIIDFFTQACKVCIHDEDATKAAFEHTFETPKGFRSRSGKPCAPPAGGRYETVCQTTPTSQPRSSLLDLAFSILEHLEKPHGEHGFDRLFHGSDCHFPDTICVGDPQP